MVKMRPEDISSVIRQQIEQYKKEIEVVNIGTVLQVVKGKEHHLQDYNLD